MTMTVCGRRPSNEAGECFQSNGWRWHPLADYVQEVAPETAARCRLWHTNDGDGLNARDSAALADALQRAIDSGETAQYVARFERNRKALPRSHAAFHYPLSIKSVRSFATFLRHCGGFAIR